VTQRRRFLLGSAAIGAVALAAGIYTGLSNRPGNTSLRGESAATLLQLTLPDVDGKQETLSQWQGKVLVVNFWATWCAPCREEMPEFVNFQKEFGSKGLQFVGIAVDEGPKVRQFADELKLNYPALIGGYGAMELSRTLGYKVMALPFTVIVGRDGKIAHTQLGPLKSDQLRGIITQLI
jgi:thiol-disulfide isomerase/thioredoxin